MRRWKWIGFGFGASVLLGLGSAAAVQQDTNAARRFAEVLGLISARFVDSLSADSLYVWSARGLQVHVQDHDTMIRINIG